MHHNLDDCRFDDDTLAAFTVANTDGVHHIRLVSDALTPDTANPGAMRGEQTDLPRGSFLSLVA
jgi:hypothetical protein